MFLAAKDRDASHPLVAMLSDALQPTVVVLSPRAILLPGRKAEVLCPVVQLVVVHVVYFEPVMRPGAQFVQINSLPSLTAHRISGRHQRPIFPLQQVGVLGASKRCSALRRRCPNVISAVARVSYCAPLLSPCSHACTRFVPKYKYRTGAAGYLSYCCSNCALFTAPTVATLPVSAIRPARRANSCTTCADRCAAVSCGAELPARIASESF